MSNETVVVSNIEDSSKLISLTNEVTVDPQNTKCLIRTNGKECFTVDNEEQAIAAVDSMADFEVKRLQKEYTNLKVFRRDLDGGKRIDISTQSVGLIMNGSVYKQFTIDFVTVPHGKLIKPRLPVSLSDENEKILLE